MKSKKAAMEMSVGTIVTIVLLMSVLILGIFLVQKIFSVARGAVDLTSAQLEDQINKLFSEDAKVVIYPQTRFVEIKQGETDGVGLGIFNTEGEAGTFSYEVVLSGISDCSETEEEVESWIKQGKAEDNIPIAVGSKSIQKVLIKAPEGSSLCSLRFRINVYQEEEAYATDFFDIEVKASRR